MSVSLLESRRAQAVQRLNRSEQTLDNFRKRDAPEHYIERAADQVRRNKQTIKTIDDALERAREAEEEPARERPHRTPPEHEARNGATYPDPGPGPPVDDDYDWDPTVPSVDWPDLPRVGDLYELPEVPTGGIIAAAFGVLMLVLVGAIVS